MQAGSDLHVMRSTRFLPLEVSAVMPQVHHIITMRCRASPSGATLA